MKKEEKKVDEVKRLVRRLHIIEGQIRGVALMLEEKRNCDDILIQISAIQQALTSCGQELIKYQLDTRILNKLKSGHYEVLNEVYDYIKKLN